MLSKEVCKYCFKEHGYAWTESDEIVWERKLVKCCVDKLRDYGLCQFSIALVGCPYILEHKVLEQEDG